MGIFKNGYGKLAWPLIGLVVMAVMTTVQNSLTNDKVIDSQEAVQIAIQAVAAFMVWAAANLPQYSRMKTLVMAVMAVLQTLYTVIIGGVDTTEYLNLGVTFLSVLGVALTPQQLTTTDGHLTTPPQDKPPIA